MFCVRQSFFVQLSAAAKTVGSAIKPLAKPLPKAVTTRGALVTRRGEPGRKTEKYKSDGLGLKEKDKVHIGTWFKPRLLSILL